MILVIDNYDSFTFNLVHYLMELGAEVQVVRNDAISAGQAISSGAKVGDPDPLAAISDECNFNEYDELIVSTLPLRISKWLHIDLPRKAEAATGLPVQHVVGSEA